MPVGGDLSLVDQRSVYLLMLAFCSALRRQRIPQALKSTL